MHLSDGSRYPRAIMTLRQLKGSLAATARSSNAMAIGWTFGCTLSKGQALAGKRGAKAVQGGREMQFLCQLAHGMQRRRGHAGYGHGIVHG